MAVVALKVLAAMQAGLEIETLRRWHFGTTYYIIAKPSPSRPQAV